MTIKEVLNHIGIYCNITNNASEKEKSAYCCSVGYTIKLGINNVFHTSTFVNEVEGF